MIRGGDTILTGHIKHDENCIYYYDCNIDNCAGCWCRFSDDEDEGRRERKHLRCMKENTKLYSAFMKALITEDNLHNEGLKDSEFEKLKRSKWKVYICKYKIKNN
jgi:hypothetical protein